MNVQAYPPTPTPHTSVAPRSPASSPEVAHTGLAAWGLFLAIGLIAAGIVLLGIARARRSSA